MQLKPLIFFASGIAISWGATVANVLTDLSNLQAQATQLDNAINAFPNTGGTLVQALAIHTEAQSVQSATDTTTSDVNSIPSVSEQDGQDVLNTVEGLQPTVESALTDIVAKQSALADLPVGGVNSLVLLDLQNICASIAALGNALLAKSPSDLIAPGQAILDKIDSSCQAAIAAYSQ